MTTPPLVVARRNMKTAGGCQGQARALHLPAAARGLGESSRGRVDVRVGSGEKLMCNAGMIREMYCSLEDVLCVALLLCLITSQVRFC